MNDVRWVALIPDPVTGLDSPARQIYGGPIIWHAPDVAAARLKVQQDLSPAAYRLCSVVSVVDWESRRRVKQYPKLTREPVSPNNNKARSEPSYRRCWCRALTGSDRASYCARHRKTGRKVKPMTAVTPLTDNPPPE